MNEDLFNSYEIIRTRGGTRLFGQTGDGTLIDFMGNPVDPESMGLPANFRTTATLGTTDGPTTPSANRLINSAKNTDNSNSSMSLAGLGGAVSLGLPGFIAIQNFTKQKEGPFSPILERVSLNAPSVKGLTRPRFTTKFRRPLGSSLAEREAGLRFADAQNLAREQQFDAQNAQFMQAQRDRNISTQNRESLINNQIANQELQQRSSELAARQERRESMGNNALTAFVSNLGNLINQNTLADAQMSASVYEELIRSGEDPAKAGKIAFGKRYNKIRQAN